MTLTQRRYVPTVNHEKLAKTTMLVTKVFKLSDNLELTIERTGRVLSDTRGTVVLKFTYNGKKYQKLCSAAIMSDLLSASAEELTKLLTTNLSLFEEN